MEKKIPSWLKHHVSQYEWNDYAEIRICSHDGNDLLEIWYYGEWLELEGYKLIVGTFDAPSLFVAKDPHTNDEILIFDGAQHGYDRMFCEPSDMESVQKRILQKLDIPASKIILKLGYSIDYEDERNTFDVDENEDVLLIDGRKIPWDEVLTDGIDYFSLFYINENGEEVQIADEELA